MHKKSNPILLSVLFSTKIKIPRVLNCHNQREREREREVLNCHNQREREKTKRMHVGHWDTHNYSRRKWNVIYFQINTFASNWQLPFLKKRKEKRKYAARPGIEPRTPDLRVRSVGHLTRKSGVLGSIPGLATYFRFSFRFFKKGSCQLLAKVCAWSTG